MPLLNDAVREKARSILSAMPNPVKLVVFTRELECAHCRENRLLAEEVKTLSDKLSLEVHNFVLDSDAAREYRVDKVPATCVVGETGSRFRFYGVPAGYEFTSLLAAIDLVSKRDSGLRTDLRERLAGLKAPVDIQVFATLTCPFCPFAAVQALKFAMASPLVTVSVVDSAEFPQLANRYDVLAVPRTVINQRRMFDGVISDERMLEEILAAASEPAAPAPSQPVPAPTQNQEP